MHSELKEYGKSIKESKKENTKTVKEVAKTYKESKKKADKIRLLFTKDDKQFDESSLIAIEKEKADYKVYKFCLETNSKTIYKRDVKGTYNFINKVLAKRPRVKVRDSSTKVPLSRQTSPKRRPEYKMSLPKTKSIIRRIEVSSPENHAMIRCGKLKFFSMRFCTKL